MTIFADKYESVLYVLCIECPCEPRASRGRLDERVVAEPN